MTEFRGIIPPLCAPLDAAGDVDAPSLERLVAHQLRAGVHGVFALSSTGEGIYLNDGNRQRYLDVVVSAVAGAVPVFAGAVDGSTSRVIDQVRWIGQRRVDAIVVTAPFYASVSHREIVAHFEAVASASRVPIVAYDIPGNVGRKLPPEISIDLLSRGVVAGLKDSSGDMADFVGILQAVGPERDSSIMTGSDSAAAAALAAGADAIVPGLGNACPDLFVELFAAFQAGDTAAVERVQQTITVMTGIFAVGAEYGLGLHASQLGALKFLLHRAGLIDSTAVSLPLSAYPEAAADQVRSIAESVGR